jgi:hypothetical protein
MGNLSRRFLLLTLLVLAAVAAGKDRDWQNGRIADADADRQPATGPVLNRAEVQETKVRIVGKDYDYIAYDATSAQAGLLSRAIANRKHGCRFIVNDEVKFAQEKDKLYVRDADGKECRLDILRQERIKPQP